MSDQQKPNIDEATGTEFVGHEWDGIEELNTPLPRWWLWTFYATIAWSLVYVVLYPAWPLVSSATQGVLGWSSRGELAKDIQSAEASRQEVFDQIAAIELASLPDNPALMQQAVAGGAAAFKVNCVQCHGAGAAGYEQYGYPNLNDDDWIWGGDLNEIEYTLNHGIRWDGSNETRLAYMPAFEGIFDRDQVDALANHVLSLSGKAESSTTGAELYAQNCAACHQPNGAGDPIQGAPALNDAIWLYGGDIANIRQQIKAPRHGVMPGWQDRLDPVTIKMLAAYVHSRGGGEEIEAPVDDIAETDTQEIASAAEAGDDGQS
ncbi:MAG: cytochrome-c oxidase, cbb3-type subunit III [Pseudomonadota bacterium]